jgi:endonuclease/exonuclease/phosphatase family metal-dependent hydrolase
MGLVLASFNVLDLFDAGDPRLPGLAALLRPHAPDVVALQEVGSEAVAQAFGEALGGGYDAVAGGVDDRGICNAVLTRRPIVSQAALRADSLPFPRFRRDDSEPFEGRIPLRRAVPDVVVDGGDLGPVRVLVVHFKSRRATAMRDAANALIGPTSTAEMGEGETRAVVWRCAEALFVRRVVDDRLARTHGEKLVVCGDFNDVSGSLPLRIVAGVTEPDRPDALLDVTERIPFADRVSVLHDGEAAAIDHALLSPTLAVLFESATYERSQLGQPGASDHAPLVVRFRSP